MPKTPIYLMPGLGVGPNIFDKLTFDTTKYEINYLEWLPPKTESETIVNYAKRLSESIKNNNCILIGVSFGGIIVQEMAALHDIKNVIIISSVKHHTEFPKSFSVINTTKMYKLLPITLLHNFEKYESFLFGQALKKKAKLYKKYFSVRDTTYLNWAIKSILNWKQTHATAHVIHIHGTKDTVFPIKNIQQPILVKDGTHEMVLTKHKELSKLLTVILNKN